MDSDNETFSGYSDMEERAELLGESDITVRCVHTSDLSTGSSDDDMDCLDTNTGWTDWLQNMTVKGFTGYTGLHHHLSPNSHPWDYLLWMFGTDTSYH